MDKSTPLNLKTLRAHIHVALRAWHTLQVTTENGLTYLLLVKEQRQQIDDDSPPLVRLATNKVLQAGIEELQKTNLLEANILHKHFIEGQTHAMIARDYKELSRDMVKNRQATGMDLLAEIILNMEQNARAVYHQTLEQVLPPPTYSKMFGVAPKHTHLVDSLLSAKWPHLIAITGIGGIGKTALTNAVVRDVIDYFYYDKIIWLHITESLIGKDGLTFVKIVKELAKHLRPLTPADTNINQSQLQIRQILKSAPHLIVIDNIEVEITSQFLTHLNELAGPSKFLLTSRLNLPGEAEVLNVTLSELETEDSADFIRDYAQKIGIDELVHFTNAEIHPIYNVVGGNPLAIKLVVSLAAVRPLSQILGDLVQVSTKKIEEMYLRIFWQAWQSLSMDSCKLLEAMFVADEVGILPEQMMYISQLEESQLWQAIDELVKRSLLEVRGSVYARRYSIHRLTATFLKTEIIRWPDDDDESDP